MTNEQKTEAPERIWAGGFADDGTGWQHHTELTSPIGTEYVRADLALIPPDDLTALEKDRKATEAAALKEAASLVPSGSDEWFDNLRPVHWKRMMAVLRKEILALIPPDEGET